MYFQPEKARVVRLVLGLRRGDTMPLTGSGVLYTASRDRAGGPSVSVYNSREGHAPTALLLLIIVFSDRIFAVVFILIFLCAFLTFFRYGFGSRDLSVSFLLYRLSMFVLYVRFRFGFTSCPFSMPVFDVVST